MERVSTKWDRKVLVAIFVVALAMVTIVTCVSHAWAEGSIEVVNEETEEGATAITDEDRRRFSCEDAGIPYEEKKQSEDQGSEAKDGGDAPKKVWSDRYLEQFKTLSHERRIVSIEEARVEGKDYDYDLGDEVYSLGGKDIDARGIRVSGWATIVMDGNIHLTEDAIRIGKNSSLDLYTIDNRVYEIFAAPGAGSCVFNLGTFAMHGGALSGGRDCVVSNLGNFQLSGGFINDGPAMGVCSEGDKALFEMTGGKVVSNAGIGVYSHCRHTSINRKAVIDHNGGGNLVLDTEFIADKDLIDTGLIDPEARIGVTIRGDYDGECFTDGYPVNEEFDKVRGFFSDDPSKEVVIDPETHELCLRSKNASVRFLGPKGKMMTVSMSDCIEMPQTTNLEGSLSEGEKRYVVTHDMTIDGRMNVSDEATIILCNGATLTVKGGIRTHGGLLNICCEEGKTGTLIADATEESLCAGIGGNDNEAGGVTICGGHVIAKGGSDAAGIGGGEDGNGGLNVIWGGFVEASSKVAGAGIGGGQDAPGGKTVIHGGHVIAKGGVDAAGIGGGEHAVLSDTNLSTDGGEVIINGGTVEAVGSQLGAGIGGGEEGGMGSLIVNGGTVNARSEGRNTGLRDDSESGPSGIGSGWGGSSGGSVKINGGTVTAVGNVGGAGIGGATYRPFTVEIKNASVCATGKKGAGIGGEGGMPGCSSVIIENSTVVAVSENGGCGIGGGRTGLRYSQAQYLVDIRNSNVTAKGYRPAPGEDVKLGRPAIAGDIKIGAGCVIDATGGYLSAIGSDFDIEKDQDVYWPLCIDSSLKVTDLSGEDRWLPLTSEAETYCRRRTHVKIEPAEKA